MTNLAGWDRALRSNQGKPVQVTILRDKKQQTLTLQVDSKHRQGSIEIEDVFPSGDCSLMAEAGQEFAIDPQAAAAAAEAMRQQAEALSKHLGSMQMLSKEQAEQLREQAEALRNKLKSEDFKIDPQQMEQLKQQLEELRKSFKSEEFKIDPKQMEELRRQMEQWKQQLEEMAPLRFGDYV